MSSQPESLQYDFGYLVKMLTNAPLPSTEIRFFEVFHTLFPSVYDIKQIMKSVPHLGGGLNRLAEELKVERIGPQHQVQHRIPTACFRDTSVVKLTRQTGWQRQPLNGCNLLQATAGLLRGRGGPGEVQRSFIRCW